MRKMPEFLDVFDRLAMPVLMETLDHRGPQNQSIHLWAYDDLADYERHCRARDTHPAYLAASGHLITAQETRLIRAVSMKALRQPD
jgi:hypothetical protein